MNVSVTARHAEVSAHVREYAAKKAGKLLKYFDRLQFVEVILDRDGKLWKAEMIATGGRRLAVVGQHASEDVLAAIDVVVDKLERQLTREKEKMRNHKRVVRRAPAASEGPQAAAEAEVQPEGTDRPEDAPSPAG